MSADTTAPADVAALTSRRRTVAPGEVIFLEGQEGDCAYVILRGEVQVTVTEGGGRTRVINRMRAGDMFGEIALVQEDCKRTATAVAADGCELVVIDKAVFATRLSDADPLLRFVIERLCRLVLMWTDRARQA
jgi:CRP-like cAMP-binding protein